MYAILVIQALWILIAIGGMSFLSTQYAWAANNVVNYEVVLANGTVVNANTKENKGEKTTTSSPQNTADRN